MLEERQHEVWICLLDRWIFKGRFTTRQEADDYVSHIKKGLDVPVEIRTKGPPNR